MYLYIPTLNQHRIILSERFVNTILLLKTYAIRIMEYCIRESIAQYGATLRARIERYNFTYLGTYFVYSYVRIGPSSISIAYGAVVTPFFCCYNQQLYLTRAYF